MSITGSEKRERFDVTRLNGATSVIMYSLDKRNEITDTVYSRVFLAKETDEIRLYGFDGDDQFVVRGDVKKGTIVRIIGGKEDDLIQDESKVRGAFHKTIVYDRHATIENPNREVTYYSNKDSLKNEFNHKSFRYNWLAPKISPGFNPDDGIYFGGGFTFKKHQFGKPPYGAVQSLWANRAFETGAYNFQYEGLFRETFGKWDLKILVKVNAPNAIFNFYGMGNETKVGVDDWKYYRVRMNQFIINSSIQRMIGKNHFLNFGLQASSIKLEKTKNRFVSSTEAQLDSTSFERKYFANLSAGYQFNSLDNKLYPRKGIKLEANAEITQNAKEKQTGFAKFSSEFSFYKSFRALTLAFRAGGTTIFKNDYEFYQAATLGGADNLRGYRRTRFAGRSNVYQNTELRFRFNKFNGFVLRGNVGLLAFFDSGRVWLSNEKSDRWHYGYGGGLWFLPFDKISFTATYSISTENNLINAKAGFLF